MYVKVMHINIAIICIYDYLKCLLKAVKSASNINSFEFFFHFANSLGPRGIYLALVSIQRFIVVSVAPESRDSKSVKRQAVTIGEIELFTFYGRKS